MLDLGAVFWIQKSTYAFDQSLERFDIELVAAAKGMDDLGLGEAFFFVPDVICKLDIFDDGAVFVLSLDGPDIHAYLLSI